MLSQRFLAQGDTPVNSPPENRGIFKYNSQIVKWKFTTKVMAERGKKVAHFAPRSIEFCAICVVLVRVRVGWVLGGQNQERGAAGQAGFFFRGKW